MFPKMVLPNSKIKKLFLMTRILKGKKMCCLKITNSSIVVWEDIQLNGI